MLGRTTGSVLHGVDAHLVEVEVDLSGGLPVIAAVGLAGSAVREGIDRIRSALRNAGFRLPQNRITVNLAPAEVRKQGAGLDLPIAVALLLADQQVPPLAAADVVLVGELGLDGSVRPIRGALAIALAARAAGRRTLLLPQANADEAALVADLEILGVSSLADVVAAAVGAAPAREPIDAALLLRRAQPAAAERDLADVRGQAAARRALEIAAAGGHHVLLSGPPGAGKTMLARALPGILPPLEVDEALEVTRIWSAAGLCRGLVTRRPFRAPHHGISFAGLTGGGSVPRPGEITLASHGVLYLDELTEFRREALEALRQPLEEGCITVVRLNGSSVFPASFSLVASMNPCPCGYLGSQDGRCGCSPLVVQKYRARLSGPLLDRFDVIVDVPAVAISALSGPHSGESSGAVRARVVEARRLQRRRLGRAGATCNARMAPAELGRFAEVRGEAHRLFLAAAERLSLSARGFDRVRRVARTLADLEGVESIGAPHVAEALQYRGG